MRIYINNEEVKVYIFDTKYSVLDRYAFDKGTIPQFLRFPDFKIEENAEITIVNIIDLLKGLKYELLPKVFREQIKGNWILQDSFVGVIWLLENKINIDKLRDIDPLLEINRHSFINTKQIYDQIDIFKEWFEKQKLKLKERIDDFKVLIDVINVKPLKSTKFELTDTQLSLNIEDPQISLQDIFNNIKPSKIIPFASLNFPKNKNETIRHFKVYKKIPPLKVWIDENILEHGLIFKLLKKVDFDGNMEKLDNSYTTVIWTPQNNIRFNVKLGVDVNEDLLQQRIFESIGTFNVLEKTQIQIKGNFKIENIELNRPVLLDLIMNDPIFSKFFFLEEAAKSALLKDRLYVKYRKMLDNDDNTMTITLNADYDNIKKIPVLNVRISKAENESEVSQLKRLYTRLMVYYNSKYSEIFKVYSKYLKLQETEKTIVSEKIKKTGTRGDPLSQINPSLFPPGYARKVGLKEQPYIVPEDQVENFIEKFGKDKIMKYKDYWYACEPRDDFFVRYKEKETEEKDKKLKELLNRIKDVKKRKEISRVLEMKSKKKKTILLKDLLKDEKLVPTDFEFEIEPVFIPETEYYKLRGITEFVWPSLRENKTLSNKEEEPCLPKCAKVNPREKKSGGVCMTFFGKEKKDTLSKKSTTILKYEKILDTGRYGILPFLMIQLFKSIGISKDASKIVKYGVDHVRDSFLYCMETAFNKDFSYANDKKEYIEQVKEKITKFQIGKQELYNFSNKEIINIKNNGFFDPSLFIRIVEKYYDCNIFLFVRDKNNPNSNIEIPNYSQAHLMRIIDPNKKSVVILKVPSVSSEYPYQCEIVSKLYDNKNTHVFDPSNNDDKMIIDELIYITFNSNDVYQILDKKAKLILIDLSVDIFKDAESQYIDQNGKLRMLKYKNGLSLITSPLPPLSIKTDDHYEDCDIKLALKFIKKYNFTITEQKITDSKYINGLFISSLNVSIGFIPIKSTEKLKDVPETTKLNPMHTDDYSLLSELQKKRKIAHFIKEYTLLLYSQNPDNFGKNNFIIIPNYQYDTNFIKDDKVIVTDKKMREKLLSLVQIAKINNIKINQIRGFYNNISDFKLFPDQIIFLNVDNIYKWIFKDQQIQDSLRVSDTLKTNTEEPYFYKDYRLKNGRIAIIQNVYNYSFDRAVSVSYNWIHHKYNTGFNTPINNDVKEKVVIFDPFKGETQGKGIYWVVQYGTDQYASILFI